MNTQGQAGGPARAEAALGVLRGAAERFAGRIAFASSLGAEDQVLTDLIARHALAIPIFTLDTARLHQETYELLQRTQDRYGLRIRVYFPDAREVEDLVNAEGTELFQQSVELRRRCCEVRKVRPLRRALAGLAAWVCGLRREQSLTRADLQVTAPDAATGLVKICPLAEWSEEEVWRYIRAHNVPYNPLHDRSFPSIGCAPCTRAVAPGEDIRAGRWWWEAPEKKECGLHWQDGKLVKAGEGGARRG